MDKDYYSHIGIPPPLQFEPQQLNSISMHSSNSYLSAHWDNNSTDQYTHFDSALSSIVSSPVTSINSNNNLPLQEFIGKLGTTCSPYYDHNNNNNNNNESTMTSCYTTPLNSPPKILHMPIIESQLGKSNISTLPNSVPMNHPPSFPTLSANKLSCFGRRSFNSQTSQDGLNNSSTSLNNSGNLRISSSPGLNKHSGQIPEPNTNSNEECCRKRKTVSRGKGKKNGLNKVEDEDGTSIKRLKLNQGDGENNGIVKMEETKGSEDNEAAKESKDKVVEPVKDYIHVRARRGEATDSHSLAERVRREKISQRMKLLQDLVPGCNKVTGKALMLDEIINYVQTLQRQVEFLSMKLATVNPRLDFHFDNLIPKEICQPNGCLPQQMFSLDGFGENLAQIPTICEDELQSIVQMGFNHNSSQDLTLHSQTFSVPNSTSYMKIEM